MVGASVKNVGVVANDTVWIQDMDNLAGGLKGKFNVGEWKLEANLSSSRARRDSQWRDVRMNTFTGHTLTWLMTDPDHVNYNYAFDTGNPANFTFKSPTLYVDTDGHLNDRLNGVHLSAARPVELGLIDRIKFGARLTDREKSYCQTTWNIAPNGTIPNSAYYALHVDGMPDFVVLNDFAGTVAAIYGANAFDATGRTPTNGDRKAGWRVKERSSAIYAQAGINGDLLGKPV